MEPTCRSVRLEIHAPADRIFKLLATPSEHHRFDASSMVGRSVKPNQLSEAGEIFTMHMTYREGDEVEEYRTDNHVTRFEAARSLEWAVAPAGGGLLGWRWRYDVEPLTPTRTAVTLTYDWTDTPHENRVRFGVPLFNEDELTASLRMLATVAEAE